MQFQSTNLNPANVLRIMGVTLAIAAAIDYGSRLIGFHIPWYATTIVITLFMYACESDGNAQRWNALYAELEKNDGA
jgi:hypothetical protein